MDIKDILKQLLKDNEEIYSTFCEVLEVDESKRVCKIKPIDGSAELFGARLQTKISSEVGLVMFPKIGSQVTATFISKDLAFISQTDEIDKILLNIGETSLLVDGASIIKEVQDEKNTIENQETTSKNTIFTTEELFKVVSQAQIILEAQSLIMKAQTITADGVTTVNGQTTVNGATTINGILTVSAAATIAGALTAASLSVGGAVSVGGGSNGGVPTAAGVGGAVNEIKSDINQLKSLLSSWSPVTNDGGAALKATISGYAGSPLSPTDPSSIGNPNFMQ